MKTLIQAVVTLLAASAVHAQQAVQWRVEDGGNGHWYAQLNYGGGRTYTEAKLLCESRGGHLATITSSGEQQMVCDVLTTLTGWIGAERTGAGWGWCTGEPWTYGSICSPTPNADRVQLYGCTCWNDTFDGDTLTESAIIEWSADCNGDGIVDYGQILDGTLSDVNDDGVPDSCQAPCVPSDLNNDGAVDGSDLGALLSDWGPAAGQGTRADINGDGIVNGADLGTLLSNWGPCGAAPTWATVIQWQPDPAVVTDAQFRDGIQATGLPWRVRDTGTGIEMLLVPPGTFEMGCSMGSNHFGCSSLELPVHQVTLTNAFYLGRYEVTQAQWQASMGSNPSNFQSASAQVPAAQVPNRPVEQVSWNTIQGYLGATGMRLPTEAEWEYACRAGTQTPFYNGSTDDATVGALAWYSPNAGSQTRPVGGKAANAFGFHDMLGNVWEWVNDRFGTYSSVAQTDPTGPVNAVTGLSRGGSWMQSSDYVRSSRRDGVNLHEAYNFVGFRVARNP